jgi:hypothetical protein
MDRAKSRSMRAEARIEQRVGAARPRIEQRGAARRSRGSTSEQHVGAPREEHHAPHPHTPTHILVCGRRLERARAEAFRSNTIRLRKTQHHTPPITTTISTHIYTSIATHIA